MGGNSILLTGGNGQLGTELQKHRDYVALNRNELELTDPANVERVLGRHAFDLIVHAAAYTNTLQPDTDPVEAAKCFATNVLGTRHLVEFAKCPIIFISTESALHPYNFYILTKLQAENEMRLHRYGYTIIRTSFRCDPFEYQKACTDMYTIADTVTNIAPLVDRVVDEPCTDELVYVGTGVKTVYRLARRSRLDVTPALRSEVSPRLPSMEELFNI